MGRNGEEKRGRGVQLGAESLINKNEQHCCSFGGSRFESLLQLKDSKEREKEKGARKGEQEMIIRLFAHQQLLHFSAHSPPISPCFSVDM